MKIVRSLNIDSVYTQFIEILGQSQWRLVKNIGRGAEKILKFF